MRVRNAYRPAVTDELEDRVVLSQMWRGASVLLSGLAPHISNPNSKHSQSIVALTNKAFDSFSQDFTQTRAVYVASLMNSTNTTTSSSFTNYTENRLNLLAQQIINSVLTSTSSLAKNGNSYVLPGMVARKINGVVPTNDAAANLKAGDYAAGTLGKALVDSMPVSGNNAQGIALNSLSQDQAIEAARVSVTNGLNVIRNSAYGVKNKSH